MVMAVSLMLHHRHLSLQRCVQPSHSKKTVSEQTLKTLDSLQMQT
jgi:hypothetical protein